MTAGRLFVISAPSGAGKTTLLKRVMARLGGLSFSVSHTTRAPRPGERDGIDYHFVSKVEFVDMIAQGHFLEHAEVHGNLYGTSKEAIDRQRIACIDVILDIDVQGAAILRRSSQLAATHIFISPPSLKELEKRLRGRGTENEDVIAIRLDNARIELQSIKEYEYLVINDRLDEAVDLLASIIVAERARAHRYPSGQPIGDIATA
ncbi:MAG: guanylate kinase [Desulforhopalus sp.]|nr:guanylate kinase [Desulforhopalus sp.]